LTEKDIVIGERVQNFRCRQPKGSDKKTRGIDEFPEVLRGTEGTANLIRASFRAGVKPAAIARTFRISQSFVNRF
jgi:hypothetical protein